MPTTKGTQHIVGRVVCRKDGKRRFTYGNHDVNRRLLRSKHYPTIRDFIYNILNEKKIISIDNIKKMLLEEMNIEVCNNQVGWLIRGIKIHYSVEIISGQRGKFPYNKRYYGLIK